MTMYIVVGRLCKTVFLSAYRILNRCIFHLLFRIYRIIQIIRLLKPVSWYRPNRHATKHYISYNFSFYTVGFGFHIKSNYRTSRGVGWTFFLFLKTFATRQGQLGLIILIRNWREGWILFCPTCGRHAVRRHWVWWTDHRYSRRPHWKNAYRGVFIFITWTIIINQHRPHGVLPKSL